MKFRYFIFGGVISILVVILFIFGNKKESKLISGKEYDIAVQLGLQDEG